MLFALDSSTWSVMNQEHVEKVARLEESVSGSGEDLQSDWS